MTMTVFAVIDDDDDDDADDPTAISSSTSNVRLQQRVKVSERLESERKMKQKLVSKEHAV